MDNSYNLNLEGIIGGHLKTLYRGIKAEKCPFDYVLYQMLINEIQPDLIIEIGTNYGGSCLYLGDIMNNLGKGMVHTIDVQDETFHTNSEEQRILIDRHPRIRRFLGGYQNYKLEYTSPFKKIMLIEDGSHSYADCLAVMEKFKGIISNNSYMIIEDGSVNWMGIEQHYEGGPLRAIEEFLPQNPQFQIDRKWCDFYGHNVTFNPNGYLKKIKI